MATVDNTFTTHRAGTTTGITQQGDVAATKRAAQKAGTGAAAGVAQTPPPPSNVGAATGFDAEYYLGTAPDVAQFTAADEKRLNDVAAFVANLLGDMTEDGAIVVKGSSTGEAVATTTALSNTYVTRTRTQDLMTLLSQIMNLERGMAIQKITNHALNNISELKQAADDMRKSASKLLMGAIANVVLSAAGSAVSGVQAYRSMGNTNKATKTLSGAKEIQDDMSKAGGNITQARNTQADLIKPNAQNSNKARGREIREQLNIIESNKDIARTKNSELRQVQISADTDLKMADAMNTLGRAGMEFARSAGHFAEALAQVDSKKAEADMAEKQANAQLEQGTKDMALQNLNAIKTMVEALLNAFKEIRDTQDQVKANIARNA